MSFNIGRTDAEGRFRARRAPRNDSIIPKGVGGGFARHIIFGGLLSLFFVAGVVALILALVGVAGWFWFGLFATATVVFFIAAILNFVLLARAGVKSVRDFDF